jgi:hypothetical protein
MQVNKLTVFKNTDGWHVRYESGPDLEAVVAVMGTDTIPLPWTVSATAEQVVTDLQGRMHDAEITLEVSGLGIGGQFRTRLAPGLPTNGKLSWTEVPGEVA